MSIPIFNLNKLNVISIELLSTKKTLNFSSHFFHFLFYMFIISYFYYKVKFSKGKTKGLRFRNPLFIKLNLLNRKLLSQLPQLGLLNNLQLFYLFQDVFQLFQLFLDHRMLGLFAYS